MFSSRTRLDVVTRSFREFCWGLALGTAIQRTTSNALSDEPAWPPKESIVDVGVGRPRVHLGHSRIAQGSQQLSEAASRPSAFTA